MKKSLLTMMFVVALLFLGVSIGKAETPVSSSSSVKLSKDSKVTTRIKLKKIKTILKKCNTREKTCGELLVDLINANWNWEVLCDGFGIWCDSYEKLLIAAGKAYEDKKCGGDAVAKNSNKSRNKLWMIRKEEIGRS